MTKELKQNVMDEIFHDYGTEVFQRNAIDYHAMSDEHTEILGQFMDHTGMSVDELKDCLVTGYLMRMQLNKKEVLSR